VAVDPGQRLPQARMKAGQGADFHGQRQQMLAQVVVQVAADALPFGRFHVLMVGQGLC
jgi:hypothetical protein